MRGIWVAGVLALFSASSAVLAADVDPAQPGSWAEHRIQQFLDTMSTNSDVEFVITDVDRSQAVTTMDVEMTITGELGSAYRQYQRSAGIAQPRPLTLTWRNEIREGVAGPSSGLFSRLKPGVVVDTRLIRFAGNPVPALQDQDWELRTYLDVMGGGKTTLRIPPKQVTFGDGKARLDWSGLNGTISHGPDGRYVKSDLEVPSFVMESNEGTLVLEGLEYHAEARKGLEALVLGEVAFGVRALKVSPAGEGDAVAVSGALAKITTGEAEAEAIDVRAEVRVESLNVEGMHFGPGVYVLELRNLDAATVAQLQQAVEEAKARDIPEQQRNMVVASRMFGLLPELLKRGPVIEIPEFSLASDYGTAQGNARLTVDTENAAALSNPMLIKDALIGRAHITLPEELLVALTAKNLEKRMAVFGAERSPAELKTMARKRVKRRMDAMGPAFRYENGTYIMDATLDKGQLTVNGQRVGGR